MNKQKTIIHFMRHGEVENPHTVRYGRLPGYHLNAEGRHNVERALPYFLQRHITHIYASPMERAQQTATIIGIALPDVPISLDKRLLETKTAKKFEGKGRDLDFFIPDTPTDDAESKQQIFNRMSHFAEEKVLAHHGQEIVAISHGDPLDILNNQLVFNRMVPTLEGYPAFASVLSFVFSGIQVKEVWRHGVFWAKTNNRSESKLYGSLV